MNPPWDVMEKLKKKEEAEHRARRALGYKDPNYLISKGPFSLNEESLNDEPVIDLKGPHGISLNWRKMNKEKTKKRKASVKNCCN